MSDAPVPPPADSRYDLIFLDPTTVTLFRTGGDAVRATVADPQVAPERTWIQVQIARAFPLSLENEYIGLRDAKDRDIGMLRRLDGLDAESRRIVDEELARRYFLPKVMRVKKVRREYETVTWEVDTDKGPRVFHVQNLRESVHEMGGGRVLITDRTGSRYEFPNIALADAETKSVLARVLS